jgi:hypothetical protein
MEVGLPRPVIFTTCTVGILHKQSVRRTNNDRWGENGGGITQACYSRTRIHFSRLLCKYSARLGEIYCSPKKYIYRNGRQAPLCVYTHVSRVKTIFAHLFTLLFIQHPSLHRLFLSYNLKWSSTILCYIYDEEEGGGGHPSVVQCPVVINIHFIRHRRVY